MAFSPDAIANELLEYAELDDVELTNMHIQKLVFLCYAYHLGLDEAARPLTFEPVEAWQYGPVFRSLYREFNQFGDRPIEGRARDLRYIESTQEVDEYCPTLEDEADRADFDIDYVRNLIGWVWRRYFDFTAGDLVNYTHKVGEPWRTVADKFQGKLPKGLTIPDKLIQSVYRRKLSRIREEEATLAATN